MKTLYLILMALGTILPWMGFADYFGPDGYDWAGLMAGFSSTGTARGLSADLTISALTFGIFAFWDARRLGVKFWWLIIPATCGVGLSLGLPLYLYLRHDTAAARSA